jgi:hypothetical protein
MTFRGGESGEMKMFSLRICEIFIVDTNTKAMRGKTGSRVGIFSAIFIAPRVGF